MTKYKCNSCKIVINETDLINGLCPKCETNVDLTPACERDHNNCTHDVVDGLAYCPICGEAMCPECGCHDVSQHSRITGYIQEVEGWNAGKRQELIDRHRVNIDDESGMI